MSLLLALAAACAYGVSDFLGGALSRRASPWAIALLAQTCGTVATISLALLVDGRPTGHDMVLGVLSGIGAGAGTYLLYRGLGTGQMNVVAPLSALGAAILPIIAGLVTGERPALHAWLGIALALPAIWLVARSADGTGNDRTAEGVVEGLAAGAAFGLFFIALGHVPSSAGLRPLAAGQVCAFALLAVGAALARAPLRTLGRSVVAGALAVGVVGATATVLYQLAVRGRLVSITAVLTSLYPAVTVALAAIVYHERLRPIQAIGLAAAAGSVVLIAWP